MNKVALKKALDDGSLSFFLTKEFSVTAELDNSRSFLIPEGTSVISYLILFAEQKSLILLRNATRLESHGPILFVLIFKSSICLFFLIFSITASVLTL